MSMERVSPFLLHLPEDIKPEELFNCIAQVSSLHVQCEFNFLIYMCSALPSQIKISRKRYDRIRLKVTFIRPVYYSLSAQFTPCTCLVGMQMAIKCYGSMEAYQKSFATPNPHFNMEDAYSPTSPLSSSGSAGGLTPPSVHIINTTSSNSASTAQRGAAPKNDFWSRPRGSFRRSIIDTLTGRWGSQNTITNGNANTIQRANTTYSGGIAPNTANANRRASTGTTTSPLKK